jgi:hypothetical protein
VAFLKPDVIRLRIDQLFEEICGAGKDIHDFPVTYRQNTHQNPYEEPYGLASGGFTFAKV